MERSKADKMLAKLEVIEKGYLEVKARCDRYEKALKEIKFVHKSSDSSAAWHLQQAQNIADEALSLEGKEAEDDPA